MEFLNAIFSTKASSVRKFFQLLPLIINIRYLEYNIHFLNNRSLVISSSIKKYLEDNIS